MGAGSCAASSGRVSGAGDLDGDGGCGGGVELGPDGLGELAGGAGAGLANGGMAEAGLVGHVREPEGAGALWQVGCLLYTSRCV